MENGLARILTGSRVGPKIHLVRPPFGEGLVCDPKMPVERMAPVEENSPTCGVCIKVLNADTDEDFTCNICDRSECDCDRIYDSRRDR